MGDEITFRLADPAAEPARFLIAAAEDVLVELYGTTSRIEPERLAAPGGGYVVAVERGEPIAGGGFVRHDEDTAEIRRMFVTPAARSRGVARRLLTAIEDEMRRAGYRRSILDTGDRQPHAEALYRSAGYHDIDSHLTDGSAMTFWGSKDL